MRAKNKFEELLLKVSQDPGYRPQFYENLENVDFYIIQEDPSTEVQHGVLSSDQELKIMNIEWNGKPYIPVFSSVDRIQEIVQQEVDYLGINAIEFMKITQAHPLLLNPNSELGKEFTSEEITNILDGTIWEADESFVAEKDSQIMIGQPSNYPHELVKGLSSCFKANKNVKKAYLAHYFNPEVDGKPHTLIGIEAIGNFQSVVAEAGMVANAIQVPDPPVDFVQVSGNEGVGSYFLNDIEPFYKKKKSWFAR